MMKPRSTAQRFTLQNAAVLVPTLLVPIPILVSSVVEAVLDLSNPAGVDISQDGAYFSHLLVWGFGSMGVVIIICAVIFALLYRKTRDLAPLALPLSLLAVQLVAWVTILLVGNLVNEAEDAYVQSL